MEWNIEINDIVSNSNQFYSLDQDKVTIGRGKKNHISIDNQYISETHIVLSIKKDLCYIEDIRSSNGTEVLINNEWKILSQKMPIHLPAQLKLAKAVIISIHSKESQIITLKEMENEETIMVLDICDSTKMSFSNDKIAYHLKKRLSDIAKPILYGNNINFFKSTGDGFLATFPRSIDALLAARKILKSLSTRNTNTNNAVINIRIALHKGTTYVIDPITQDIHGNDINITFHMESLQKKSFIQLENEFPAIDRILCSKQFYQDVLSTSKVKKKLFRFCGLARLKGIKEGVEIFLIQ